MPQEKNYFVVTGAGLNLLANLQAGMQLELTRVVVGDGEIPDGVDPRTLNNLINPIAQATSTVPLVTDNRLNFDVEYRNDLGKFDNPPYWIADGYFDVTTGKLATGFSLREYGVFANNNGTEILLYYATIAAYPEAVYPYTAGNIQVKRYPVQIEIMNEGLGVATDYDCGAFVTHEELTNTIGDMRSDIAEVKIDVAILKAPKYGICTTEASVINKTVDIDGFEMFEGAEIIVHFVYGNTADIPTLNISGTGGNQIWFRENPIDGDKILEGASIKFVAHGTHWDVVGDLNLSEIEEMSVVEAIAGTEVKARSVSAFTLAQLHDELFPGYAALVALVNSLQARIDYLEYIVSHELMDYQPAEEQQVAITSAASIILITGQFTPNKIYI